MGVVVVVVWGWGVEGRGRFAGGAGTDRAGSSGTPAQPGTRQRTQRSAGEA